MVECLRVFGHAGFFCLCLYWAHAVFVPLAMAVFLAFLLAPVVSSLQRRGLRRTPAVILVVLLAALVLGGGTWRLALYR